MYDAIGASDADGYGSSFPCVPYTDCPSGMGYPQIAARTLTAQGFTVNVQNLGIPTSVIGPDFEALGQQYNHTIIGNFIVAEAPFVRIERRKRRRPADVRHPRTWGQAPGRVRDRRVRDAQEDELRVVRAHGDASLAQPRGDSRADTARADDVDSVDHFEAPAP